MPSKLKIKSIVQLMDLLPQKQAMIVDVLRQIIIEQLPEYCKEKFSYNVPFFYGHKSICLVWPAAIPRGGIKEGVLLGFWHGYLLPDKNNYLDRGTNKKIYYKIYTSPEQIDQVEILIILQEAIKLDLSWKK